MTGLTAFIYVKVANSSNIAGIAFVKDGPETQSGTLRIKFHSGGEYEYSNFGEELAEQFFAAESKGSFFHRKIKNSFIGVKVEEVPEEPTETRFSRQRELETEATGKLESEDMVEVPLASEADAEALVESKKELERHHSLPNGNGQEF